MDSLDRLYDFGECIEENDSNISEYENTIIKFKILSLKNLYELEICYIGFGNYKYKKWTECCDEAATYLYSNFKGWEYPKSERKTRNCNK